MFGGIDFLINFISISASSSVGIKLLSAGSSFSTQSENFVVLPEEIIRLSSI